MSVVPSLPTSSPHPGSLANSETPLENARKCLVWGWCLVGGGCLIGLIPFIGILVWIIAPPLVVTGFVLAIVSIAKGRTAGGICLLLFSIFVAPFTLIFGPILSSLIGVAAVAPQTTSSELQGSFHSIAPISAPTTQAETAAEREEIQRQLDAKATLGR